LYNIKIYIQIYIFSVLRLVVVRLQHSSTEHEQTVDNSSRNFNFRCDKTL